MFNGIIYNLGTIKDFKKSQRYVLGSLVLEISSNIRFSKKDIGESVSCDGVCLTLIRIKKKVISILSFKRNITTIKF